MSGLRLEEGKFYRNSLHKKCGPISGDGSGRWFHYFGSNGGFLACGSSKAGNDPDLVAEWTDIPASPVRTVAHKEIVPGNYGAVVLHRADDGVDISVELHSDDLSGIRAAIATLTEIVDALEAPTQ